MFAIYLVLLGDKYEGYTVLSAYSSYKSAKKFCINYMANDDLVSVLGEWVARDDGYWWRSHNYLTIHEIEVLE